MVAMPVKLSVGVNKTLVPLRIEAVPLVGVKLPGNTVNASLLGLRSFVRGLMMVGIFTKVELVSLTAVGSKRLKKLFVNDLAELPT